MDSFSFSFPDNCNWQLAAGISQAKQSAANQVHNVSGTAATKEEKYYVYAYDALSIILQQFMVSPNKTKFNFLHAKERAHKIHYWNIPYTKILRIRNSVYYLKILFDMQ